MAGNRLYVLLWIATLVICAALTYLAFGNWP
jgi:hypothetical protein